MTTAGGANGRGTIFKLDVGLPPSSPRLAISQSGASALVSWPSSGTAGFNLEETGTLGATANWSPIGAGITDNGTNKSATLPIVSSNQFFRLRKP